MREQIEKGLRDLITSLGITVDNLDSMSGEDMMALVTPLLGEQKQEETQTDTTQGVPL